MIQHCEEENGQQWDKEKESRIFTDVWIKTAGDHESLSRRNVIVEQKKTTFSPGHIVRPGVVIHFGRISCGGFIKFLGTFSGWR